MTEAQYKAEIERLEEETKRLNQERRNLINLADHIRSYCPGSEPGYSRSHDWTVVRADDSVVYGGGIVRSAEFACDCGATMSIADGQAHVGG